MLNCCAKLAGEIAFALDPHAFAGGAKDRRRAGQQFLLPGRLRPINGHGNDQIELVRLQKLAGIGMLPAVPCRPGQRRCEVAVMAGEVGRNLGAVVLENPGRAVGKRAHAKDHDRGRAAGGVASGFHAATPVPPFPPCRITPRHIFCRMHYRNGRSDYKRPFQAGCRRELNCGGGGPYSVSKPLRTVSTSFWGGYGFCRKLTPSRRATSLPIKSGL